MIISPITQFALDNAERKDGSNDPNIYAAIMGINIVANLALPAKLITMSNPNQMSYLYKGLDPERYGIARAVKSRKQFQMMSSQSYQLGSRIGGRVGAAKLGGRIATRFIPAIGQVMLAYDAYDLVKNRRLFGIQL